MLVALITEVTKGGLGEALAEALFERRSTDGGRLYKVYATGYSADDVAHLKAVGITTRLMDITDEASVKRVTDSVLAENDVDLLICNPSMKMAGWMVEQDYDLVRKLFDVNVFGVFRVVQAVAPRMMDRRKGKIALTCAASAWFCAPFFGAYSGWKATMAMMTEALRIELEPFGVHISSIAYGYFQGIMTQDSRSNLDYPRYERPEGQYHRITGRTREIRDERQKLGPTAARAAEEVLRQLEPSKPRRYLYTGAKTHSAMFGGLIQMWVSSARIAKQLQATWHLDRKHLLGRALK